MLQSTGLQRVGQNLVTECNKQHRISCRSIRLVYQHLLSCLNVVALKATFKAFLFSNFQVMGLCLC